MKYTDRLKESERMADICSILQNEELLSWAKLFKYLKEKHPELSREVFTRLLKKFERQGFIKKDKKKRYRLATEKEFYSEETPYSIESCSKIQFEINKFLHIHDDSEKILSVDEVYLYGFLKDKISQRTRKALEERLRKVSNLLKEIDKLAKKNKVPQVFLAYTTFFEGFGNLFQSSLSDPNYGEFNPSKQMLKDIKKRQREYEKKLNAKPTSSLSKPKSQDL